MIISFPCQQYFVLIRANTIPNPVVLNTSMLSKRRTQKQVNTSIQFLGYQYPIHSPISNGSMVYKPTPTSRQTNTRLLH